MAKARVSLLAIAALLTATLAPRRAVANAVVGAGAAAFAVGYAPCLTVGAIDAASGKPYNLLFVPVAGAFIAANDLLNTPSNVFFADLGRAIGGVMIVFGLLQTIGVLAMMFGGGFAIGSLYRRPAKPKKAVVAPVVSPSRAGVSLGFAF